MRDAVNSGLLHMVLIGLGLTLVGYVIGKVRSRGVARRRAAAVGGVPLEVPVRLLGLGAGYPRFWRAGRVDTATAMFHPRGFWGRSVSLAGATIQSSGPARKIQGLPLAAKNDVALTYMDREGRIFQLVTPDTEELPRLVDFLAGSAAASTSTSTSTSALAAAPAVPADRSGLRGRVPFMGLIVLVLSLLWVSFWLAPLAGADRVDATVVRNPGPGYMCEVAIPGRAAHGRVDCDGDAGPGDHVAAYAMGWPRGGVLDQPLTCWVMAGLGAVLGLAFAIPLFILPALHRRKLRRLPAPGRLFFT